MISGEPLRDEVTRRRFWENFCFANFVPRVLGYADGVRERPTKADFHAARPRFVKLLKDHEPHLVVFFSKASWDNRPWGEPGVAHDWPEVFGFEPEHIDENHMTRYPTSFGHDVIVTRINHPRNLTKSVDEWRNIYVGALGVAKQFTASAPDSSTTS